MPEGSADVRLNVAVLPEGMYILHQIKADKTLVHKLEIMR